MTCAGLGDSRAMLDTGAELLQLSVDHRVATHRGERRRLEAAGALVAPIDVSGARCCKPCSGTPCMQPARIGGCQVHACTWTAQRADINPGPDPSLSSRCCTA